MKRGSNGKLAPTVFFCLPSSFVNNFFRKIRDDLSIKIKTSKSNTGERSSLENNLLKNEASGARRAAAASG